MKTKRLQIYGSFPASHSVRFGLFTATTSAAATQLSHQSRINGGDFTFPEAEGFSLFFFLDIRGCPFDASLVSGAQMQQTLGKFPPIVGERHTCKFQRP